MRVLTQDTVGEMYSFGWRHLWPVLRENLWWYALLAITASLASVLYARIDEAVGSALQWLVTLAAIASATRLVVRSYRMTVAQVSGVIAIWLVFTVIGLGIIAALTFLTGRSMKWGFLFVALLPLLIWLSVKFTLATPFYTVKERALESIGSALVDSWEFVESDRWWSLFGLQIAIGFSLGIPYLLLKGAGGLLHASAGLSPISLAVMLAENALAIIGTVWSQISLVAMVSTSLPRRREFSA